LTLIGSLIALAPQAYADNDQGIDFDAGGNSIVLVSSTSVSTPNILRTVTATCPQNGFLFATAATAFVVKTTNAPKFAGIIYSLAKDSTTRDTSHFNALNFLVPVDPAKITGTNLVRVGSNSLMRVDSCTAGQSVTYRFLASKLSSNASDPVDAEQPTLVVTFFQARI
jgi:hypothetical protein